MRARLLTAVLAASCASAPSRRGGAEGAGPPPRAVDVHGHRGDRGNVPPGNTVLSFQSALGYGVDVLEGDLQITAEGSVVFGHDDDLETTGCAWAGEGRPSTSRVSSMSDGELAQWDCHPEVEGIQSPPHLDEVVALDDAVGFNLELKRWGAEAADVYLPALIAQDDACGGCLAPRLIVQSFDWVGLEHVHTTYRPAFDIRLSLLAAAPRPDEMKAARGFAEIWSPRADLASTEAIAAAHALGFEVAPWTVNDEAQMRRLIDAGVDAIITDVPDVLIRLLEA
ncbi:MAG: glycerophosphodiester phosphodiesterase [Nannocystaceae bacterium]|nr:hypothetical protein [bacterium]